MEQRLPTSEIQSLINIHRKLRHSSDADRIKCIIYWGRGYSWKSIQELLFITDFTIKSYIDQYQSGGAEALFQTKHTSHNHRLTLDEESQLSDFIDSNNIRCSTQVCAYVKEHFGKDFTTNGMTHALKRLGFRYKKPKRLPGSLILRSRKSLLLGMKTSVPTKLQMRVSILWTQAVLSITPS